MDKAQTQTLGSTLRQTLRNLLRNTSRTREGIAEELGKLLGRKVSVSALNKWAGEASTDWRVPADAIPALCEILHDNTLQRQLLSEQMKQDLERGEWVRAHGWIFAELRKELDALLAQERAKGKKLLKLSETFRRAAKGKAKGSRKPKRRR